jgi:hypothetical protein
MWPPVAATLGVRARVSFRRAAQASLALARCPPLHIEGGQHIPAGGPVLLTINHYTRPGFQAWWLALAVSAVVPVDVHWIVTAAWTYPDPIRARTLTPLSRRLARAAAQVYGFTPMPPMPPDPAQVAARAAAVRRVLAHARTAAQPVIGLAPEGRDAPRGPYAPVAPPPGSGRFMLHLARLGLSIAPVAGFEAGGALCLHFGPPFCLTVPAGLSPAQRDRAAAQRVMAHIAARLPPPMRGRYARAAEEFV